MSKKNVPALTGVTQTLNINAAVDLGNVAAIVVSGHEDMLLRKRMEVERQLRVLNKDINELDKTLDDAATKLANAEAQPKADAMIAAATECGFKEITYTPDAEVEVDLDEMKVVYDITIKVITDTGYRHSDTLTGRKTMALPAELAEMGMRLKALWEQRTELGQVRSALVMELGTIGTVERRAKACVAQQMLASTPNGQAMLEAVKSMDNPCFYLESLGTKEKDAAPIEAEAVEPFERPAE